MEQFVQNRNEDVNLEEDEAIKSQIEIYETTLNTFDEKLGENDDPVQLNNAIEMFEYLNRGRHDIFLNICQASYNLDMGVGDIDPKRMMLDELNMRNNPSDYNTWKAIFDEPNHKGYRKTPDIVFIPFDNETNKPTGFLALDVAVTYDPTMTKANKLDKYRPLLKIFSDLDPSIGIIYYNISNMSVEYTVDPPMQEQVLKVKENERFRRLVGRSERLKTEIKRKMTDSDLTELNDYIKSSHYNDDENSKPIENCDFAINFWDFLEEMKSGKRKWLERFFDSIGIKNKILIINALRHTKLDDRDEIVIQKLEEMFDIEGIKEETNLKQFFQKMKDDIFMETLSFKTEGVPRPPTEDEISEAIINLESKAKDAYDRSDKPKLLYPIYLAFSKSSDLKREVSGPLLKKKRLERLYNMISNSDGDMHLKRALKLILKPSQVPDDIYTESFMKGESYIKNNGTIVSKEDFLNNVRERSKNLQKLQIKGEGNNDIESEKASECIAVSYKKGEVISIRPSNIKEIKELLNSAGVGRKINIESRSKMRKEKVKSLPFWDEELEDQIVEDFQNMVQELQSGIMNIGKNINDKEFKEFASEIDADISSDDTNSSSSKSNSSNDDDSDIHFERGMKYMMRHNEIFWENISFGAHMGGNGFRIIQGITDNNFVILFPSESIMKGETGVPYINVGICQKGDTFNHMNDLNTVKLTGIDYKIYVSLGRRIDRPRLSGYLKVKPTYYTALSIINHMRQESGKDRLGMYEATTLSMIINNVNINTSSLLDNLRYMVENTMADYSFCKEFIEDKFLVPIKNHVQMYLYQRSKEILRNVRQETEQVKIRKATMDSDGNINLDTTRVMQGSFSSLVDDKIKYRKPEHLISEIYTLFFAIPKGLHGNFHNLLEIHKTPLEIQLSKNEKFGKKSILFSDGYPKNRLEYDPKTVVIASLEADRNLTNSFRNIRNGYITKERPNETPLRSKTTSSTKSTLIQDKPRGPRDIGNPGDLFSHPSLADVSSDETYILSERLLKLQNAVSQCSRKESKRKLTEVRKEYEKRIETSKADKNKSLELRQVLDFLSNKIKMNTELRVLEYRTNATKDDYKLKVSNLLANSEKPKELRFFRSGVVLTEVIKDVFKEENDEGKGESSMESIGTKAKKSIMSDKNWMFAIRKKGQRTQKDREIFVTDLSMKYALYVLEHAYKQKCGSLIEEKISEPGDLKIISMARQVRDGFEWLAREIYKKNMDPANQDMKGMCFHFNLDMTKWAPKDNLFKFIFMVSASHIFTVEEKLTFWLLLDKMASKKLYLDEELFYKLAMSNKMTLEDMTNGESIDREEELFYKMTDGFKTNEISIVETWLQGQLNYCSSWLHTGTIILWKEFIKRAWSNITFRFNINVHSDDEQTSVYLLKNESISEYTLIKTMWSMLDHLTRRGCMEISIKKSNISKLFCQFVSQYNFGGEQCYLWVKPVMSSISGCPYTTLKDDVSQTISKISEACSKGAPVKVARVTLNEMKMHIWNLYGIRTKSQENRFCHEIGIKEEHLPSCLGGFHIHDFTTLAIGGPKTQDQMTMMELLRYTGASTEIEVQNEPKSAAIRKALALFYVLDIMTSDTLNDEEDNSNSVSLNPFKPTRFKYRRSGNENPFLKYENDNVQEVLKRMKDENPGLGILKPTMLRDLFRYYFILYNNSNFKASLAGQSPAMLHLHKIVNRKKGVFKIKESGNILLEKYRDEDDRSSMTCQQVSKLLLKMIQSFPFEMRMASLLRQKYIIGDPEFKVLSFTSRNALSTSAVIRKNPVPKRKPNPSDYSTITNRIPNLLCYFFDEDYFKRNGFRLQHPSATKYDLISINQMFPVEFGWLRNYEMETRRLREEEKLKARLFPLQQIIPEKRLTFNNYKRTFEEIEKYESGRMKIVDIVERQDRIFMREREVLEEVLLREEMKEQKGGDAVDLEITTTMDKMGVKNTFDIYSRLVNNAKVIDTRTQKVLFCSPTGSNDLHEITLAVKTVIESDTELSIGYYLSANQRQDVKNIKMAMAHAEKSEMVEYVQQMSNLLKLMWTLGIQEEKSREIIKSAKYRNSDLTKLREGYKNLPKIFRHAAILPLSMVWPDITTDLISKLKPLTIDWVVPETHEDSSFEATIYYENMTIRVSGMKRYIQQMSVMYYSTLVPYYLNKALHMFCSDLMYKRQDKPVDLTYFFDFIPIKSDTGKKPIFGYSQMKKEIVDGNDRTCTMIFRRIKVGKTASAKSSFSIWETKVNYQDLCVEYNIGSKGEPLKILHKNFRSTIIDELSFDNLVVDHYYLNDLAKKNMYNGFMSEKLYNIGLEDVLKNSIDPHVSMMQNGTTSSAYFLLLFMGRTSEKFVENVTREVNIFMKEDTDEESYISKIGRHFIWGEDDAVKYQNENVNNLMGRISKLSGGNEMGNILKMKEEKWSLIVRNMNMQDLRSVKKSIEYLQFRSIQAADKIKYENTSYHDLYESTQYITEQEALKELRKRVDKHESLQELLIVESQIPSYQEEELVLIKICLLTLHYSNTKKSKGNNSKFFQMLSYSNDYKDKTKKNARKSNVLLVMTPIYMVGDKVMEIIAISKDQKQPTPEAMMQELETTYSQCKPYCSPSILYMAQNVMECWKKAQLMKEDKAAKSIMSLVRSPAQRLSQKTQKKKRHAMEFDRKSTKKAAMNDLDNVEKIKDDPDSLASIVDKSRYFDTDQVTTSGVSGSETERILSARMRRKRQKTFAERMEEKANSMKEKVEFSFDDVAREFELGETGDYDLEEDFGNPDEDV